MGSYGGKKDKKDKLIKIDLKVMVSSCQDSFRTHTKLPITFRK
jgi:hypothetical protein